MKKFALLGLAGTAAASALMATPAQAVTFFTDRASWESALSGAGLTSVNEEFEEFAVGEVGESLTTETGVTIRCTENTSGVCGTSATKLINNDPVVGEGLSGFDNQYLTSSAVNLIDFGITTSEVVELPTGNRAFGVNVGKFAIPDSIGNAAEGVVNFVIGGQTVATYDFPEGDVVADEYFFGVLAHAGDVVEEITLTGYTGGILYDNLAYAVEAEEPEAVPEPASMLGLLTVGAVAAGGALKRKQAAKA